MAASLKPKRGKKVFRWVRRGTGVLLLGIILFFALRPEGEFVAAARGFTGGEDLLCVKVLTWNVRRGKEGDRLGANWEKRKQSFSHLLEAGDYDVLCFQEVLLEQLEFFQSILKDHECIATGRVDGKHEGEHCPVFFNRDRFELVDGGTFWLSSTPEEPSRGWEGLCRRICTWVELRDRARQMRFRVYNTHIEVTPYAQYRGAEVVLDHISNVDIPVILAGDMNCPGGWPGMRVFTKSGLREVEASGALTYHVAGKGIRCLDHILVGSQWGVVEGGLIKKKGGEVYPSDHFGLWVRMELEETL